MHQSLRTQLAQQWVVDNQASIRAAGFDEGAVVAGLAAETPSHPLWVHFERVHVRSLRRVIPDSDTWGIGAGTRIVGPDLEAILVHDMTQLPPDGIWRPDNPVTGIYPLVFQRVEDRWLLAILGASDLIDG